MENSKNITIISIGLIVLILFGIVFISNRNQNAEVKDKDGNIVDLDDKDPGDGSIASTSLTETQWIASMIQDSEVPGGVTVTATFGEDGSLSGNSGCNNYNGSYTVDEATQTMKIGENFQSTMMGCVGASSAVETEYLSALGEVAYYEIEGNILQLKNAEKEIVVEYKVSEPVTLENSSWSAISINNGKEAVVSTIIGTEVTAVFDEEGKLTGTGGCNNYFADYKSSQRGIEIGPIGSTKMACLEPEGVMDQEQSFFAALENSTVYKMDLDRMEFRDDTGALQVSFQMLEN